MSPGPFPRTEIQVSKLGRKRGGFIYKCKENALVLEYVTRLSQDSIHTRIILIDPRTVSTLRKAGGVRKSIACGITGKLAPGP